MDSLLDYFTSVAQIAIETQIENFLYKKLCDEKNMEIVLGKYNKSFTEKTRIDELDKEQKKRGFIEKPNTETNVCHVSKKKIEPTENSVTCKYCTKKFNNENIKRIDKVNDNEYARNLCPNCNKPFEESYPCFNILVHSNILKQFNDVKMNKITWFSIRNINEKNGGRTRRRKRQHKWTRNRKKTKGKRAKSNKKRVQKKKPTKTRKYRSFILLGGGAPETSDKTSNKKPGEDYWDKKTPLYDEADEKKRNERHENIVNSNDINNVTETDPKTKERILKNLTNLERLKEIKNHHLKKERYNAEGELINNNDDVIKDNSGKKPIPNIRTQISQLKDSFEKRRNAAMNKDTIPEQLFAKNKLPETSESNIEETGNDEPANAVPSSSSSGCCQRTPYNDFIQLISLIFNMSTEFIKEFFGLGEHSKGDGDGDNAPEQSDILDKIMEILVSSIKLTLPDALGKAFKIHMAELYMSKSNQSSMKEQINLQTMNRIEETYWKEKIKDLKKKVNAKKVNAEKVNAEKVNAKPVWKL